MALIVRLAGCQEKETKLSIVAAEVDVFCLAKLNCHFFFSQMQIYSLEVAHKRA